MVLDEELYGLREEAQQELEIPWHQAARIHPPIMGAARSEVSAPISVTTPAGALSRQRDEEAYAPTLIKGGVPIQVHAVPGRSIIQGDLEYWNHRETHPDDRPSWRR